MVVELYLILQTLTRISNYSAISFEENNTSLNFLLVWGVTLISSEVLSPFSSSFMMLVIVGLLFRLWKHMHHALSQLLGLIYTPSKLFYKKQKRFPHVLRKLSFHCIIFN
ncbi:hypothetical protein JHK84_031015 [Glycine max]|uniref:Uncharacterized protein n=2 Tax=Glycine subgen. Soja TaxID=1462606 RepID=A0A0R0HMC6_SOYBN|nr:hypothetical protein JHK87_030699 [Glycine soja]KAG4988452.1 hypothetical protein JHK85_031435 [Glycine max]KAG5145472.1 hypothetical protein JHK84_031015 [Glycine max]KAH1158813.1 hypothetical protein GYH30_030835 [Glycine max]RZB79610.1 hypothetical protein D0Y65_029736 [Glycine soja]